MIKLFVVGSPRSGTTLLQSILTQQAGLYTLKETHFFRHLHRWRPVRLFDRLRLDPERVRHAFAYIAEHNVLEGTLEVDGIRRLGEACRAFDRLLTTEASIRSRTGWLEKTPEHMFFIDEIRRFMPGARFIHILRDGPDVVASLYDAKRQYPGHWGWVGDLDRMIGLYNRYVRATRAQLGRPDTFVLRYDDLLERDLATLDALAGFLGLPPGGLDLERIRSYTQDIVRPDEAWKVRQDHRLIDTRGTKFRTLFDAPTQTRILTRLTPTTDITSG